MVRPGVGKKKPLPSPDAAGAAVWAPPVPPGHAPNRHVTMTVRVTESAKQYLANLQHPCSLVARGRIFSVLGGNLQIFLDCRVNVFFSLGAAQTKRLGNLGGGGPTGGHVQQGADGWT